MHTTSHYLPPIPAGLIIGIAIILNIHTLKMCFQLVSSITAFTSLNPIHGVVVLYAEFKLHKIKKSCQS